MLGSLSDLLNSWANIRTQDQHLNEPNSLRLYVVKYISVQWILTLGHSASSKTFWDIITCILHVFQYNMNLCNTLTKLLCWWILTLVSIHVSSDGYPCSNQWQDYNISCTYKVAIDAAKRCQIRYDFLHGGKIQQMSEGTHNIHVNLQSYYCHDSRNRDAFCLRTLLLTPFKINFSIVVQCTWFNHQCKLFLTRLIPP